MSLLLISLYFDFPIIIIYIIIIREILGVLIGTILFFRSGFQGEPNIYGRLGVILVNINIAYYIGLKALFSNVVITNNVLINIPSWLLLVVYLIGMIEYFKKYYKDLVFARRGT